MSRSISDGLTDETVVNAEAVPSSRALCSEMSGIGIFVR